MDDDNRAARSGAQLAAADSIWFHAVEFDHSGLGRVPRSRNCSRRAPPATARRAEPPSGPDPCLSRVHFESVALSNRSQQLERRARTRRNPHHLPTATLVRHAIALPDVIEIEPREQTRSKMQVAAGSCTSHQSIRSSEFEVEWASDPPSSDMSGRLACSSSYGAAGPGDDPRAAEKRWTPDAQGLCSGVPGAYAPQTRRSPVTRHGNQRAGVQRSARTRTQREWRGTGLVAPARDASGGS